MKRYPTRVPRIIRALTSGLHWSASAELFYLTFDDGPHPCTTYRILSKLDAMQIRATFFLTGINAERYPDIVYDIITAGHQVANHGYRHIKGWYVSDNIFQENVRKGSEITQSNLFRPPYGQITWSQYRKVRSDHNIMMWTIMPGDFMVKVNITATMNKVNQQLRGGDIVVLHDNPDHIDRCLSMLDALVIANPERWTTLS